MLYEVITETRAIVDAADLVFFIGCRAGSVTTERWRHPAPGTKTIVHLDVDPGVIGTNYRTDAPVVGDARLALEAICDALDDLASRSPERAVIRNNFV